MATTSAEKEELSIRLLQQLSTTRHACTSIVKLSSGSTNFVFRGILAQPILLQDGSTAQPAPSVIIKHSTDFLSVNRNFHIDICRSIAEDLMLAAAQDFSPPAAVAGVKIPRLYQRDQQTNTLVMEDFPDTANLESILNSPASSGLLTEAAATSIGYDIGSWLQSFHTWAAAPAQTQLRTELAVNEPMRQLKYDVTYGSFIKIVEDFPDTLGGNLDILEAVKQSAAKDFNELNSPGSYKDGSNWGLIHGDFCLANVLAPTLPWSASQQLGEGRELVIIDWEFAQVGHHAFDLGHIIGDLYERKHFHGSDAALWIISGFVDGYGGLSDEMAYQTAIRAGIQLLHFYNRGPPSRRKGTSEQIASAIQAGSDWVVRGWEKDRRWFESSVLAPLFGKGGAK